MAVWVCTGCGASKEGRCKPKKCAACGGTTFEKDQGKPEEKNK